MGRKIAKVAVARAVYAIDKPYDYLVPLELEGRLEPGMRVLVPFAAGNRGSDGLVLSLYEAPSAGESLKLIQAVLDDQPVLDARAIQLALWMRERCFCTVYDCVKAMLPAGLYFSLRDQVAVRPGVDRERAYRAAEGSSAAVQLLDLLWSWGGKGDMEQIRLAFGARDPNPAIRRLLDSGTAVLETGAQRAVADKTEKLAVLEEKAAKDFQGKLSVYRSEGFYLEMMLERIMPGYHLSALNIDHIGRDQPGILRKANDLNWSSRSSDKLTHRNTSLIVI